MKHKTHCSKVKYSSEIDARAGHFNSYDQTPPKVYYCSQCQAYHVSVQWFKKKLRQAIQNQQNNTTFVTRISNNKTVWKVETEYGVFKVRYNKKTKLIEKVKKQMERQVYSVGELAIALDVTSMTILRWIRQGDIEGAYKVNPNKKNSQWLIPCEVYKELVKESKCTP